MRKCLFVLSLIGVMLSGLLLAGCAATETTTGQPVEPPFDEITVWSEDGTAVATLVLRRFYDPVTGEQMTAIRTGLEAALAGSGTDDEGPTVRATAVPSGDGSVVAFAYAVYIGEAPAQFSGFAGNEASVESCHRSAQEWFMEELGRTGRFR